MSTPVVAVVTVVHGRHRHLRLQERGLAAGSRRADVRCVVAMDDDEVAHHVAPDFEVIPCARTAAALPLARARNLGAEYALDRGADVLLFLDVGGSMDPFVKLCEELFSAATTEFKNLEFFYYHNCPYEGVWKDNTRRFAERTPMWDVLHKFGHDYKLVFVGDASMSPYEITHPGGSVEHFNEESGAVWLHRMTTT